jgi:uncharacterized membrane protein
MENVITPDPKDAADNKVMGILAYLGILFLVPLLAAKESPFARFHANQGALLFIVMIAWWLIMLVLTIALALVVPSILSILSIISLVGYVGIGVLVILGIINAAKGEMKELPVIGKFRIIK